MKTLKTAILLAALVGSSIIATSADARGGGGRHHHHHHRSGGGFFFAAPFFYYPGYAYYPRYYYPPYHYPSHYPSSVAAQAGPPVYIEQSAPAAGPAPSQSSTAYWYYCRDSQTYYPYVQSCASPWQEVVPNSAPPS